MSSYGEEASHSFFTHLTEEQRAGLKDIARRREYKRGTTLFNEGDIADRVVVVLEGNVKVSYFTDEGKEVVLAVRGPGDLLGELSALDSEPLSATVTAMSPVTGLVLSADAFTDFLRRVPDVALLLLRTLSRKLRDADRKRVEFAEFDTVGRVARRLVELAERFGDRSEGRVQIDLGLTQEELAGWTGSSREAVSKALQALKARGWIATQRRSITIIDLESLRRRSR
jgi:CRP/FNR family cyclic AMP-dependent transcriptional regulator